MANSKHNQSTTQSTIPSTTQSMTQSLPINKQAFGTNLFESVLEHYPYGLNVTQMDGTLVYANQKFMDGVLENIKTSSIGNYNILNEENREKWGLSEHIKKAFSGQVITTKMLKFPNKELIDIRYSKSSAFVNLYQDITSYPLFDPNGNQTHVVTLFVPSTVVLKRAEVMATKELIDLNWREPLSLSQLAKHTNLSESRLRTLFKEETGFTIHDYYNEVKMKQICELLNRSDLSISEVFNYCGTTYNSYYLSLFKVYTGHSPREFRRLKNNFNQK